MSATIMMPNQIESAIRDMCADAMSQAVAALAEKYGFDTEEANRFLAADTFKEEKTNTSPRGKTKADKADSPEVVTMLLQVLYADEVRAEVRELLISALSEDEKLKPQDVVKAIAARWKDEDEEEEARGEWKAKATTRAGGG